MCLSEALFAALPFSMQSFNKPFAFESRVAAQGTEISGKTVDNLVKLKLVG